LIGGEYPERRYAETGLAVKTAIPKSLYNTLAIALGYAVGAQLGFQLALLPQWSTTLLWPPSGVALAAVLLGGRRTLPGIFLGAFVTNLTQLSAPLTPLMLGVCLAISATSTLSALAAGKMLKRIAPEVPHISSGAELFKGCIAMGLACTIAASGGVASLYFSGLIPEDVAAMTWSLWWLGDFSGMLIFGPIAWLAARFWKAYRTEFRPGPIIPAIILNSTFAAAAILAFMMLWSSETDKISQSLAQESTAAANSITETLHEAGRNIESIRSLVYSSDHVSADEFRRYTMTELRNGEIESAALAAEWIPRITDPQAWEELMHNEGQAGVELYEIDNSGRRIPVAQRDEYFPVQYVEPSMGANQGVIGFDIGSEKLRRATLELARDTGQLSMTSSINLIQVDEAVPAMMIAVPVYRPDTVLDTVAARRANLTGFAIGVYLIRQMIDNTLLKDNADVDIHLFDKALPISSQWYHTKASPHRAHVEAATPAPVLANLKAGLNGTAVITFADHNWLVVATPGPTYVRDQRTWIPWAVHTLMLALGIALSSILIERISARKNVADERKKTERALLEAQLANDSKSYFMAAASHDIKQPLVALTMLADTLLLTNPPEATVPIVNDLKNNIRQMSTHFDSLMDFGKFHAGGFRVTPASFRLSELRARIDLEIAPLCAQKGLTWNLDMPDFLIWTDQELLLRLFRNLLTNAVRYTDFGEVCCRAKANGDIVEFLISDTGIGIPGEQHEAIFGKFVRLENSGIGTAGTGLGLSIVEKINQALVLNLKMSSVIGKGTEFRFRVLSVSGK